MAASPVNISPRAAPVDRDTLFQVASMSKWLTAWGVMTLVESGRIDLDAPVSRYLKRWTLPPSQFDNDGVTVRRLLSHTAGLTDGLGYRGFAPGEKLQTLPASLTHAADAMPGAPGAVRVGLKPGSAWRYSGGGFVLLQLLIEDVTGEPFNDYMRRAVLLPLGMRQSTFVAPDPAHLADVFDARGGQAIRYKFTALAAASLYTSTGDMTRFLQAQVPGASGEPPGRGVLRPATLALMRQPQARLFLLPMWGLGNALYASNNAGGFVVGHDGNNYPAINTTARLDPATGNGIVVLETGNPTLASEIGGDWVFWQTGHVDIVAIFYDTRRLLTIFAAGALLIVAVAAVFFWRGRRRAAPA
ncbi:MAG TPA: serine hydrolase domain-containing protein [Rhizomicrobium sp.]|jgi:CubicO group peptidase (beta-lactamase class C family)|nr:serine hydrolase domain-containing protein [Rhizomicrobium sp.]